MIGAVTSARSARDGEETRPVSRLRPAWENGREDGREFVRLPLDPWLAQSEALRFDAAQTRASILKREESLR